MEIHFEGFWNDIRDVPNTTKGYRNELFWYTRVERIAKLEKLAFKSSEAEITRVFSKYHILLAFLSTFVGKGDIKILDIGGGLGEAYLSLPSPIQQLISEYHILDVSECVNIGREIYQDRKDIFFHSECPRDNSFDIIYAAAAIHYIEDISEIARKIAESNATYLLFTSVPVGDFVTHAKLQIHTEYTHYASWFFNYQDFCGVFFEVGYKNIFSSPGESELFWLDENNKTRAIRPSTFLFKKIN
jgi:putative methyltransferase (TIGR04325 family)